MTCALLTGSHIGEKCGNILIINCEVVIPLLVAVVYWVQSTMSAVY
jgi:hypothetical protein